MQKENLLVLESLHPQLYRQLQAVEPVKRARFVPVNEREYQGQHENHPSGQLAAWNVPAEFQPNEFPAVRYKNYKPNQQWLLVVGIDALCLETMQQNELSPLSPIIVIEPDEIKLLSYFKIHSYIHLFRLPNVYWFAGSNAFHNALLALENEIEPYFVLPSGVYPVFNDLAANEFALQTKQFMAAFQSKSKDRFAFHLQTAEAFKRKFTQPVDQKKVMLVIPSVACWIVLGQGIAHGFRENGLEVFEYRIPFPPDKITPYETLHLLKTIRQWSPDFLFTLSHASDLFVRGLETIPIKRVVWYVDEPDHLIQKEHGPYDEIFYSWRDFGERLNNRNGTLKGEMIVGAFPLPYVQKQSLQCDVGFVGSIEDHSLFRTQCPQDILLELDRIVESKLKSIKTPVTSLVQSSNLNENEIEHVIILLNPSGQKKGMTSEQVLILYLHQSCIRKRRLDLLSALNGFDVKIFGNASWELLLRGTPIKGAFQGHGIPYDVCCNFYASCRISLNIHPPYLHSGPNQRDIDIPMCDGFLLTDLQMHAQSRLSEFFESETEIALYEEPTDLRSKVEYFLDHPAERKAITEAAKIRIHKDHTFTQRVKTILNDL